MARRDRYLVASDLDGYFLTDGSRALSGDLLMTDTAPEIYSQSDSAVLSIYGDDTGGTKTTLATLDPDGEFRLFHNGSLALGSDTLGAAVYPSDTGTNPGLFLRNSSETNWARFYSTSSILGIRGELNEQIIRLEAYNTSSALTTLANFDPDSSTVLNYAGTQAFATAATGINVYDTSGTVPIINLYDDALALKTQFFSSGGSSYWDNKVHGGSAFIRAENTSGTLTTLVEFDPDVGTTAHKGFAFADGGELTISAGVVTATAAYHTIDTQSNAATDDLDTINYTGPDGSLLIVRAADINRTVVMKDQTGNMRLSGDFSLDDTRDTMVLIWTGSNWLEVCRSNNN